jgi:hypothetical protein
VPDTLLEKARQEKKPEEPFRQRHRDALVSNSDHGSDRRRRRKRHSAIVETRSVVRFGVRTNRRGSKRLSHRFEEHENHERRGDFGWLGQWDLFGLRFAEKWKPSDLAQEQEQEGYFGDV